MTPDLLMERSFENEFIFKTSRSVELIAVSQSERTKVKNRKEAEEKFYIIVSKALTIPKKRKATRVTLSSKLNRLEDKKNME